MPDVRLVAVTPEIVLRRAEITKVDVVLKAFGAATTLVRPALPVLPAFVMPAQSQTVVTV